jgi:hypothetical protein
MSISPRLARRWLAPVLLAFAMTAGGARADDGILTWIVRSISFNEDGDVIPASAMQVPQIGTALATGQQISTAAGQRMVLVNGRDLVEIKANSTVVIGDDDAATSSANLNLVTGTVHVEVGKRAPGKTFSVGAPYLVATVKGTQFDVSTSSASSAVSVTEGVVSVSSLRGGNGVDVTPGNTASVKRGAKEAPSVAPTSAGSTPGGVRSATTDTQGTPAKSSNTASARDSNSGSSRSGDSGSGSGGSGSDASGSGASGGSKSGGSSTGGSSSSDSGSGGSTSGGKSSDSASSGGSSTGGSSSGGGGLGGAVGGTADAVGGTVSGTTDKVGDAVSGATDSIGGAVGGALGDTVSGVGGAVGGTVSGLGDAVGGVVGGVGGLLGGALGGSGSSDSGGSLRDRK